MSVLAVGWQVLVAVLLAPLTVGVARQARARLEGRAGAGIRQPARDLVKLLRKEPVTVAGSGMWTAVLPIVFAATSLVLVALVPLVTTVTLPWLQDDLFVVVSVLLMGTVLLAAAGLAGGTAFGGMGASRHLTVAALVEPTVLVAVYALSVPTASTALSDLVRARLEDPVLVIAPVSLLALVALGIAVVAETGRLPVDNPATHLELTMIHEAMVLEASGRDLAWLELGSWLRMTALFGLLANLAMPWGIDTATGALDLAVGSVALAVKVMLLGVAVGVGEVFLAKVRLFRVPELLAGSFALAFLAVTASYLVA